jgi:hypothetical protein
LCPQALVSFAGGVGERVGDLTVGGIVWRNDPAGVLGPGGAQAAVSAPVQGGHREAGRLAVAAAQLAAPDECLQGCPVVLVAKTGEAQAPGLQPDVALAEGPVLFVPLLSVGEHDRAGDARALVVAERRLAAAGEE